MGEKRFLKLNDIEVYRSAFKLSNYVWEIVMKWNYFEKDTIGKQFARAVDSISANIAEGFGRFNKKEKIHYFRIANGSRFESLDWNEKAHVRKLIKEGEYNFIINELKKLALAIQSLIKFTNEKLIK